MHDKFDPGRYGSSFASVYDDWYPGGDEGHVVAHLAGLLRPGARVLELGVGTGRLALPLTAAGFEVVGLDASPEMLETLTAKDQQRCVTPVLADAGEPAGWAAAGIRGPFDAVLAANNLLLNLASGREQRSCVMAAADLLVPGGAFVVELQQISPGPSEGVSYTLSGASTDEPVVIASETDPVTGRIEGQHIELHGDGSARVRPWSVCPLELAALDRWCVESGLRLTERRQGWASTPWEPGSAGSVSTYRI